MVLKIKDSKRDNFNKGEALKELLTESKETITILVPVSLKEKAKIKAIQNKTNITNLVLGFLENYVGDNK